MICINEHVCLLHVCACSCVNILGVYPGGVHSAEAPPSQITTLSQRLSWKENK